MVIVHIGMGDVQLLVPFKHCVPQATQMGRDESCCKISKECEGNEAWSGNSFDMAARLRMINQVEF